MERWKRLRPAMAVGVVAVVLPLGALGAQNRGPVTVLRSGTDGVPAVDVRALRRSGFNLFSAADAAHAGMRMTGGWGSSISNYGDCSNLLTYCQSQFTINNFVGGTGSGLFFELETAYGVPPHEWLKLRQEHEGAGSAIGGGFMANGGEMFINRPYAFGPRDGTLGTLFSGATATSDGGCRDHTGFANGNVYENVVGLQLLPGSDCPETWGTNGWEGAHPIDLEGYKARFDELGSAFTFDFWSVPDSLQRLDKLFLGTGFHTYGEFDDYNADQLVRYGEVVPGGAGAPVRPGYPLGLQVHFDAFNFAVATVASAKFVQQYMVNRSADVWNTPIDYDSVYFGFTVGALMEAVVQNVSMYAVPELGLVLYHLDNAKGATGPCSQSGRTVQQACNPANFPFLGYDEGAAAVIILKSPLGDLRNKLFTRTPSGAPCTVGVDPFCDPSHPLAGDTITFNQMKFGGFGAADAATWGYTQRAAFGFLSSTEDNTLDGRSPSDINSWQTFRNVGFPTVQGVHNKFVPGGAGPCQMAYNPGTGCGNVWDWNKDGNPDTLGLQSCGPNGCARISSDTLANGYINAFGNIGGVIAAGPFPLAAGDTAAWTYAIVADVDSANIWSQINAAIELYLTFYLAPESPPRATIVSTQVEPATDDLGTAAPSLTFTWSDDPETWVDPFLTKLADDMTSAAPGTPLGQLLALNPGLGDRVRARASDNLESIEIYKSCDGGSSFTSDANCDGEPALDERGANVAFGWQTYATLDVDDFIGGPPNSYEDANVQGGRTYLYVVVAKSRGAKFLVNTASGPDTIVFAPSIRNVLSRSTADPNVVSIYVPAGRPAGYVPARTEFTRVPVGPTVPFAVTLSDRVEDRSYRAVFGNQFVIGRDSSKSQARPLGSTVVVNRFETVDVGGVGTDQVIRTESFRYEPTAVFPFGDVVSPSVSTATNGDTVTTLLQYDELGYVLVGAEGPIWGSQALSGAAATPSEVFNRPDYPGFQISIDQRLAGTFNTNGEAQLRGAASIAELKLSAEDTVVPRNIVNGFMVQWQETAAQRASSAVGVYEVSWAADPWGTQRGFFMNRSNPAATEAEVRGALEARAEASTSLTDAETAALVGPGAELVEVSLPFTIRNVSSDRDVRVAMRGRTNDRLRLGFGTDTISIQLPADQWAPGDELIFIEDVVQEKQTAAGLVLVDGEPVDTAIRTVTFSRAVLGCNTGTEVLTNRCNPLATGQLGAHGYNPMRSGDVTRFDYYVGVDSKSEYAFDVEAAVAGDSIRLVTDSAMALVKVVPNPFVIFSQYQNSLTNSQLLFTGVPPTGTLRIYTVAGQFVQQITWDPTDLENDGDLFWNLQSREGIDVASGLYLWVMTAPSDPLNPQSAPVQARGKFVIIRGDTR